MLTSGIRQSSTSYPGVAFVRLPALIDLGQLQSIQKWWSFSDISPYIWHFKTRLRASGHPFPFEISSLLEREGSSGRIAPAGAISA